MTNPLVVCIEICFKQQNYPEFSHVKIAISFFDHDVNYFFHLSYANSVHWGMFAIVALIISMSGLNVPAM